MCVNEYLAIDSDRYLYEQPSRINCSVAGCINEKLRRCLIEQVLQGSNVYSTLSSIKNWILRYIRTVLLLGNAEMAAIHTAQTLS